MYVVFQKTMEKIKDSAEGLRVNIADPEEKPVVEQFRARGAPMPTVLAIAPTGAVTKAFTKSCEEKEPRTAFVSPCTQRCLKALQDRKLVFVCLVDQADLSEKMPIPKGVEDFKADKKYSAATEIVMLNVRDTKEATFLTQLNFPPGYAPMTILLGPPGVEIGSFRWSSPKERFAAALAAPRSGCCPGGSCGAGGCGQRSK